MAELIYDKRNLVFANGAKDYAHARENIIGVKQSPPKEKTVFANRGKNCAHPRENIIGVKQSPPKEVFIRVPLQRRLPRSTVKHQVNQMRDKCGCRMDHCRSIYRYKKIGRYKIGTRL